MSKLLTRDLNLSDLVELEKYARFPLETLVNKPKILQKTFEDDGNPLGIAILNGTVELSVVLADCNVRDKVRVLREIECLIYREVIGRGYRDCHTFITDPEFANILVQHFNFQYCKGRALVRLA